MRLWSLHPKYLDPAGLVAVWREGLLAQAVLSGLTRGYTKHPQLVRFREQRDPVAAVARYLEGIADEAVRRDYSFDRAKIRPTRFRDPIEVTRGQLDHEWEHLRAKLRARSPERYRAISKIRTPEPHPSFVVVEGPVAEWEKRAEGSVAR